MWPGTNSIPWSIWLTSCSTSRNSSLLTKSVGSRSQVELMQLHDLMRKLHVRNNTKIVLLVADGLGGLPLTPGGKTELETAITPNLDALAIRGVLGLST